MVEVRKEKSVAQTLATFTHDLSYEDLPDGVKEAAKGRILDALSCCLAGRDLPASRTAASLAKESRGDCTVPGYSYKASVLDAAMANAVMAHSGSQDDLLGGVTHPGSVVVPAAIAVAEQEGASGAEMLLAVVLGYELVWRVLRATGQLSNPAFRPGTIFTTFGAAAAAGRLMGLDEAQLAHAFGYAASLTPGTPSEGWWGGTMEPMFQIGVSARSGILSALLARAGATAAPEVLEGRHGFFRCWSGTADRAVEATKDLGHSFAIAKTFVKPFAACGANQVPIQVASTLAKYQLTPSKIIRVVEKLRPGSTDYAGLDYAGPFHSYVQAMMSMQFCAAAAILGRPMNTPAFISEHYNDSEVAEVASKVELRCEEGRSVPRFEVYTADGRVLVAEERAIDRSIHIPTIAGMQDKFRTFAQGHYSRAAVEEIVSLLIDLDKVQDVRQLMAKLRR